MDGSRFFDQVVPAFLKLSGAPFARIDLIRVTFIVVRSVDSRRDYVIFADLSDDRETRAPNGDRSARIPISLNRPVNRIPPVLIACSR